MLFAAALLFSTGGAAIKLTRLGAWQIAGFRSAVAACVIATLIPRSRRNWSLRTLAVAGFYAATLVLFVAATKMTTAANAVFLQATAPLYLLFIGPFFLKEKVTMSDGLTVAVMAIGAVILLAGARPNVRGAVSVRGDLFAAISGFTWACTIAGFRLLSRKEPEGESAAATVVAGNLIALLVSLPFIPAQAPRVRDIVGLLYLGTFQIGLGYVLLTRSIRFVPALEAGVILLVEPVLNPLWAWLFFGERSGTSAVAGGAIIIAAALLNTWNQTRAARFGRSLHETPQRRIMRNSSPDGRRTTGGSERGSE
jgi:drug/metabolite transporter (DMT)-like permease